MADLSPAETARLDQEYARTAAVLDGLVKDSRVLLNLAGPERAAASLASALTRQCPVIVASLLGLAVVRLQQAERGEGNEVT